MSPKVISYTPLRRPAYEYSHPASAIIMLLTQYTNIPASELVLWLWLLLGPGSCLATWILIAWRHRWQAASAVWLKLCIICMIVSRAIPHQPVCGNLYALGRTVFFHCPLASKSNVTIAQEAQIHSVDVTMHVRYCVIFRAIMRI